MHRRFRTTSVLALLVVSALVAIASTAAPAARAASAGRATCLVHSLPSFVDQGELADAATVADVVEVECNPFAYGTGAEVTITAEQLYDRCQKHLTWYVPNTAVDGFGVASGSSVNLRLDADGNATVALLAGPNCMPGESLIALDEDEAPYETFTASFQVLPPVKTPQGVSALPPEQVEDAGSSAVGTIVEAEFPGHPEAKVRLDAEQLYDSCKQGERLIWVRENGEVLRGRPELAGEEAVQLDDNGNGFAILIGGDSCAEGTSVIEADLEESPFTTETTTFTVLPPQPTEEPSFTIEKLQEIKGSGTGFKTSPLTGEIGQTVDYEIVVRNTANVPETFSAFTDANCDEGTIVGGPGSSPVAPGESTTYTCDHVLRKVGMYTNEATVTGESVGGIPLTQTSNQVLVEVPPKPAFTIEKLQEIKGSGAGFTPAQLTGAIGQTVDYEIIVTSTGNVALTFSSFTDANCDSGTIAGGPGSSPVAPGESTTYTCDHVLTTIGSYTNEATVTGAPEGEPSNTITHTSNQVVVEVPPPGHHEASFTIEKLQEIKGSGAAGASFTRLTLTGAIGQTVDYEIVVKNTGEVALTFSGFSDANCDAGTIAGGPGSSPVAPGESTTYTCDHVLTTTGSYTNVATVTGTPELEAPITHESNRVLVEVPREPKFTIEKLQEIKGSGTGFKSSTLTGATDQTVDYEIVVTNTGNVALTFSGFTDVNCDSGTIAGGPGSSSVAPGESTTYTCDHVLTGSGSYTNVASVTGTPEGETPITHTSNKVVVEVPASEGAPKNGTSPSVAVNQPPPTPTIGVLAECAGLAPLQGASGPKRRTFTVQTSSIGVKQITFYLDGRKLETLKQSQARRGTFTLKINPLKLSFGAHKLSAKTLLSNPGCKAPARSSLFVRPYSARVAPRFTG